MAEDYLDQIQKGLAQSLKSKDTIFKNQNEPTHPVQIRESTYNSLKQISFKRGLKLVDLTESLLQYALSNKEFEEKK